MGGRKKVRKLRDGVEKLTTREIRRNRHVERGKGEVQSKRPEQRYGNVGGADGEVEGSKSQ